jgi:hypothetical protein
MKQKEGLTPTRLKAPKSAAIAGIIFSVLLIISFVLVLKSVPANVHEGGAWLSTNGNTLLLAFNLVPYAGIAFLWFIGVVRDRLGNSEDQFFSTVFLGSGLLFLAMLFVLTAIEGSIIVLYLAQKNRELASGYYDFGRTITGEILNVYALKMAGVFMISACTLFIRTRVVPRWIAILGYVLAAILLLRIGQLERLGWVSLTFPLWTLLISVYFLIDNYRMGSERVHHKTCEE